MKYLKEIIYVLSCVSILQSCNNSYERSLQKIVEEHNIPDINQYNTMVIIPGSGCTGCISRAEDYFLQNCDDTSTLFILTYNFSLKEVVLRLSEENINKENVILDKEDKFHLAHYEEGIYPIVCLLDKGRITSVQKLN